jgi:hypothetical protein
LAFLINVPVAVIILTITPFVVRASRSLLRVKLDVPGAVSVTLGLLTFVFGLTSRSVYALLVGLPTLYSSAASAHSGEPDGRPVPHSLVARAELVPAEPKRAAIFTPSGLPRPVQASQPVPAAKSPLLPCTMSCSTPGVP